MKRTKGFDYPKENLYNYCDNIKYTGADYSKNLIENNVSHLIFYNSYLSTYIKRFIEPYMVRLVDAVKIIRVYFNIAVDKNYKKIN
ncbi:hypothetical protein [uncultured Methanobrevibacter sp.]|uniref:hypothetical protein n=1 Tax=uncultured Methanobrevibacter sp. TaxID=253161 RepID=UPI0025F5819E|nr:hypothetical protein [uncultured Methanobrevibacter sp.]MBR4590733.1 hypothetical protein [Bacteroidaceae bacterium]